MPTNDRASRSYYIACLGFLLAGCSLSKPWKPAPPPPKAPIQEIAGTVRKGDSAISVDLGFGKLDSMKIPSAHASQLYLTTLDNFLTVSPDDPKVPEVLLWKGNHYYNLGEFEKALEVYASLLKKKPSKEVKSEAQQMTAQAHAQMGHYEDAEKVYRNMLGSQDIAAQAEAKERLAQAIYLQAEKAEKEGRLQTASDLYARIPREFSAVEIAPVALFNAGVMQEKQKRWKEAIALYGLFFDAFFESKLLPKVLFREAKCRELDGQWESAGVKYLNLVKAYPDAPEAEPSLYNAGYAFANAKLPDSAARAFEAYAKRFPQNPETPNLMFRAVEIFGELKQWDKVAELQTLFTRRYASDRGRLIQALCLGGTAAFQRGRMEESVQLMSRVLTEYAALKGGDASSRYYAAQAQYTLAEVASRAMRAAPLRGGSLEADSKAKTSLLRKAVMEYLKVLDYRIVDWTLRTAYSMGQAFEDFGTELFEVPRPAARNPAERLDNEEDALVSLSSAFAKAQQQYLQVLSIARKQEVNNKYVEDANTRLIGMAQRMVTSQVRTMAMVPQLLKVDASTPEKAIAGKLLQISRISPLQADGQKYFNSFLEIAQEYELDSKAVDSLGGWVLGGMLSLGGHYLAAAELARGAPMPKGFQPMESFFYKAKLIQEGIPKLESKAAQLFLAGLDFSEKYGMLKNAKTDSLRQVLGRLLFVQAKCLDLLAQEALIRPPIPENAGPEQRKTYAEKLETEGYALQDTALNRYHQLIDKVVQGKVPAAWGELAFARLYQIEPDKWSRSGDVDTLLDIYSGKEWSAMPALPGNVWPPPADTAWKKVRRGVVKSLAYPDSVKTPFRFLWSGDKGLGPKVDSVSATYIPWRQIHAQRTIALPARIHSMELWVVAPQEWAIMLDNDTLLTSKMRSGPWPMGLAKEVFPVVSKRLGKTKGETPANLRLWAQNQKPTEGFGIWLRLRIRYKLEGNGPVYPWNQTNPTSAELKKLLEFPLEIPNFTTTAARP